MAVIVRPESRFHIFNPCYITTQFGEVTSFGIHDHGVDITTAEWRGFPGHGAVVNAPVTGVVSSVFTGGTPGGQANFVSIASGALVWNLSHVDAPPGFRVGFPVYGGMPAGVTGPSGRQDAPHVHLGVRRGQQQLDPASLLPGCSSATP
jgi:murein DD-endopeptidase MepM/ murein hydrolase activator NlpD